MAKAKEYLTSREAAKLLDVAVSTIQQWTNNGLLHSWKTVGGHRRITKSSIEKMLGNKNKTGAKTISIVVVEDNPQDQKLYKEHFELWDFDIELSMANDGYAGLIRIGKVTPDIIITDLMMPNMNGFEMIKAIKENQELSNSFLIVVSALTKDEIKKQGGITEDVMVLEKPVSFSKLESLVNKKYL